MNRPLLQGEQLLREWSTIKLTDRRVFQESTVSGSYNLVSVPIDEVRMVAVEYVEHKWMLYAGIFLAVGGILGFLTNRDPQGQATSGVCLLFGLGLVWKYFASRRVALMIKTNIATIEQAIQGKKTIQEALELLTFVETQALRARHGVQAATGHAPPAHRPAA